MSRLTEKLQEFIESLTEQEAQDLTREQLAEYMGTPAIPMVRFLKLKKKAIGQAKWKKRKAKIDSIKTILDDDKGLKEIKKLYPDAHVVDSNTDYIKIKLTKDEEVE